MVNVTGVDDERAPYDPMPHGPSEVGVGPWEGPWPTGAEYDASLLANGDRWEPELAKRLELDAPYR